MQVHMLFICFCCTVLTNQDKKRKGLQKTKKRKKSIKGPPIDKGKVHFNLTNLVPAPRKVTLNRSMSRVLDITASEIVILTFDHRWLFKIYLNFHKLAMSLKSIAKLAQ